MPFLPITKKEMLSRGWDEMDFIFVTGDAYVDHPSFGTAILSRLLEAEGYRVGVIPQPDWKNPDGPDGFTRFGRPKYAFLVNAGVIDSMVAHYTAAKRKRSEDAYSPGGRAGCRPDRAVTVYSRAVRRLYPDTPIVIGGLEASLRRFAHYDYWEDAVRPSVLLESGADILSFGMGEGQTLEIAARLAAGQSIEALRDIRGVCYLTDSAAGIKGVQLPSFESVRASREKYAEATRLEYDEQDAVRGKTLIQPHGHRFLIQNPPAPALETAELDRVYGLPYERYYHPAYEKAGGVPAIREVEFSVTHNRGCFGACNFCSIAFHQGRQVTVRSEESVLAEVKKLTENPHFKGYIHDVGGPTANFRGPSCAKQLKNGLCKGKKCLAPTPCKNLEVDHEQYLHLLRKIRSFPRVKRVFIRSGIRFDYLLADPSEAFFKELVKHHVSGQLKVAPEHCSDAVLDKMGKPHIGVYRKFVKRFYELTKSAGKEQYLVPYLMSSHPGSALRDAVKLALFLKEERIHPEQVQDFYPTPGTLSTCMYHTGLDPYTMQPVFVPKTREEKAMQRALLQYFKPENRETVEKALRLAGREDLIGPGPACLIKGRPRPSAGRGRADRSSRQTGPQSGKNESQSGKNGPRGSKTGTGRMGGKWEPQKRKKRGR
ncbi:MAG: YgiQ family radical SAM protein [Clostridiales bacterium]|nr:YgiQ family radical SAM protein [Clostridiales bacterium]